MGTARIRRIHFVEYNAKVGTLQMDQVFPKYGTPLLAAILREKGYGVRIFLEGVSDMAFEKISACDAVCFPVFAPALNKIRACGRRFREARPEVPIFMCGPQVCLFPQTLHLRRYERRVPILALPGVARYGLAVFHRKVWEAIRRASAM